jgi:hypothetical protein
MRTMVEVDECHATAGSESRRSVVDQHGEEKQRIAVIASRPGVEHPGDATSMKGTRRSLCRRA